MISLHREIIEKGSTHKDYVLDLFNALLSTRNQVFNDFIQREKDDWYTGKNVEAEDLISSAITKYDNMVAKTNWKMSEPRDATIL